MVKLSYREHFIAHWMLHKALGKGMSLAFIRMINSDKKLTVTSRMYENVYSEHIENERNKTVSEETKHKIREKRKLQIMPPCSEEKRNKIRISNSGRERTPEAIKKQKESIASRDEHWKPRALKIGIFNDKGELEFICNGNMREVCKENELSFTVLREVLKTGEPVSLPQKYKAGKRASARLKLIGWSAKYLD